MVIKVKKEPLLHWNYFLALEKSLENTSRFVEFDRNNEKVYSIELAHLLLASSSEVDVVAKGICNMLDSTKRPRTIDGYRAVIVPHLLGFCDEHVFIPRYGLDFTPWERWPKDLNPLWWKSYNNVKHQRNDHFQEANLKNVLNSMSGLLIMIFYFYKLKFSQADPAIFHLKSEVVRKLQPESNFMRLSENYYPSHLLLENNF
jgi:hypothetical protein